MCNVEDMCSHCEQTFHPKFHPNGFILVVKVHCDASVHLEFEGLLSSQQLMKMAAVIANSVFLPTDMAVLWHLSLSLSLAHSLSLSLSQLTS